MKSEMQPMFVLILTFTKNDLEISLNISRGKKHFYFYTLISVCSIGYDYAYFELLSLFIKCITICRTYVHTWNFVSNFVCLGEKQTSNSKCWPQHIFILLFDIAFATLNENEALFNRIKHGPVENWYMRIADSDND